LKERGRFSELLVKTQFGPFVFDRAHQLLAREGQEVPLPPRVLGVLAVLTERPGQIVSKQELIETVWKDAFVSETSLTEAISFLRQVLGDDPQEPSYIQTVHRRGYRFLTPVPESEPAARAADLVRRQWDVSAVVLPWCLAVLLSAVAASALWRLAHPDGPAPPPVARFDINAPAGTSFNGFGSAVALSADGSRLALAACAADACRLYVRRLDESEAHAVAGSEGGAAPFLSPDGATLGFFADGKLKRVAATGGTPVVLADVREPLGAEWTDDSSIVFAGSPRGGPGGLMRVAANGSGTAVPVHDVDARRGEMALAWPDVLPGGRVILATVIGAPGQPPLTSIVAISTATGERTPIIDRARAARFVAPGTLVFVRDGQLTAAAFDPSQLKIVGQPVSLGWSVSDDAPQFAVSGVGSFAVAPSQPEPPAALAFAARDGRVTPLAGNLQHLTSASLSPDGRRLVALAAHDVRADIWAADVDRGALSRLTFEGEHRAPFWSADGRAIVFAARASGPFGVFAQSLDASAARRISASARQQIPSAVTAGNIVTFTEFDSMTGADVWIAPLDGGAASAVVNTPFDETGGALSPDGRWLAYQSNESNRWEVYARALPGRGAAVPISADGGTSPVWSRDGRTIFYSSATGVMAVDLQRDRCREGESPCDLAPSPPVEILHGPWTARGTTPDGRVLVERQRGRDLSDHVVVTLQWTRELQRLVPPPVVSSPK
jgi:eukaryotic-like serine/threonine-protein kinase